MPGLLKHKKARQEAEIPTSSMADIAFLLLIFFLVTTTIDVDTGIGMTLPPKLDETVEPPPVKERNILKILINEQGMVLLEDRTSRVEEIKKAVKDHVVVNRDGEANPSLAEWEVRQDDAGQAYRRTKAIVSIKTDRRTPYNLYIQTLDEVWLAYFELWDEEVQRQGLLFSNYRAYSTSLEPGQENQVRKILPAQISLAEPDPGS